VALIAKIKSCSSWIVFLHTLHIRIHICPYVSCSDSIEILLVFHHAFHIRIHICSYTSCSDSVKILLVIHHTFHIRFHIQILQRLSEDITCISSYISYTYPYTDLAATQRRYYLYFIIYFIYVFMYTSCSDSVEI